MLLQREKLNAQNRIHLSIRINQYISTELTIQDWYKRYSLSILGRGRDETAVLVMCCRIASRQALCSVATGIKLKIVS